jgi:hypothetical protein
MADAFGFDPDIEPAPDRVATHELDACWEQPGTCANCAPEDEGRPPRSRRSPKKSCEEIP